MEAIVSVLNSINGVVWGPIMLALILGVGLYLQVGLGFLPVRKLGGAFRLLWQGRKVSGKDDEKGEISPYNALMTSLSATVGTGNIAGVATAVFLGGPGALFWMWCTAFVGLATKYFEALLAVRYREVNANGDYVGGPMYYIKNGLGPRWNWLAVTFAVFGTGAGFGIGNMVQSNSIADVLASNFGAPNWLTGVVIFIGVAAILIGGLKRIAQVAGALVPFMAGAYLLAGLAALAMNASALPGAFALVFKHAFTPSAAEGGFAGAAVWFAIRYGVARGVFSNEAGLGSAPIAHAAAQTNDPVRQGLIAMLGTFIDTIIVCTITGMVILTSGVWTGGEQGATLTAAAFGQALPGIGPYLVAISLTIFAFTTILGWSVYGERCAQYLFGAGAAKPFRVVWCLAAPLGAVASLDSVWLLSDTLNALMAVPNLIALALLSPVGFKLTRDWVKSRASG